jgi:hypothetical protein
MAAGSVLESLVIKTTKGSGLETFKSEDFAAAMFQTSPADGQDINKAVRMKNYVAALGARGDYVEFLAYVSAGDAGDVPARNVIYVEMLDYTAVPTAVQHTVFGEMSHFKTPKSSMQESMLDGIDIQHVGVTVNVAHGEAAHGEAACSTATAQKIRGTSDSRVTVYADHLDAESWTLITMKVKPNSDGVFLFRAGDIIWADNTSSVAEASF